MHEEDLRRGAIVNLLGLLAKLIHPLFFIFVIRMFGTEIIGVYFVATFLMQVVVAAVTSGHGQGTILFASPHVESGDDDALYRVLGNGFVATVGASLLLMAVGAFAAEPLVARYYADRPELGPALSLLLLSLPLAAFSQIAISATMARMRMEYEALINGLCKPFSLLGFAAIAYLLDLGLLGLIGSLLASQALLAVLSAWAYARHFSFGRTLRACWPLRFDPALLAFSIPQSLNMTFTRYVTRLDVIMLAAYGQDNHAVAFYSAGALITSSLREIKLAFGAALAPVAARYHAAAQRAPLEQTLGQLSRWTTTLVAPFLLALVVLRDDVLALIDAGFVGDTRFMLLLLIPPLLSCAFGLAGNLIVYLRHSTWNLANSVLVAGTNTGLNMLWIPEHGLLGAAAATAVASAIITLVQMIELQWLAGVHVRASALWKPLVGLAAMSAVAAYYWDPARMSPLGARVGLGVGLALGFLLLMVLLRHEEIWQQLAKLRARTPAR